MKTIDFTLATRAEVANYASQLCKEVRELVDSYQSETTAFLTSETALTRAIFFEQQYFPNSKDNTVEKRLAKNDAEREYLRGVLAEGQKATGLKNHLDILKSEISTRKHIIELCVRFLTAE